MIIITGASGQLGREIARQLVNKIPENQVVAGTRDVQKMANFAQSGVQLRITDFADPAGLAHAFTGMHQVLLVSVDKLGEEALRLHNNAIGAARSAGVQRVLYTSHMGARADSMFVPAVDHTATEDLLAANGTPFTSLRHGFYAESGLHMIGRAFETGELRVPEDGPVSWTARNDLAEADAIILADPGRFDGMTPPLTAPQAFTMAELANIASEMTQREIKHVTLTDTQWISEKVALGVPAPMAELLLGMFKAARLGDFSVVDPALEKLLGRRPQTMRDILTGVLKPAQASQSD
ncbi:SDR family oxidoreductase [Rouxiella sp. WC2420]|uniref:SDR family oxidoreductase n=1 Tax=Rouxiella sp. WC2420 TaxID=3234145 RepID=A0AB39VKN6_9GAMM